MAESKTQFQLNNSVASNIFDTFHSFFKNHMNVKKLSSKSAHIHLFFMTSMSRLKIIDLPPNTKISTKIIELVTIANNEMIYYIIKLFCVDYCRSNKTISITDLLINNERPITEKCCKIIHILLSSPVNKYNGYQSIKYISVLFNLVSEFTAGSY